MQDNIIQYTNMSEIIRQYKTIQSYTIQDNTIQANTI